MSAYSINIKSTTEDSRPENWVDQLREAFISRNLKIDEEWDGRPDYPPLEDGTFYSAFTIRGYHGMLRCAIIAVCIMAGNSNVEVVLAD